MDQEVVVVRIYLSEADHGRRGSLLERILAILHDQHRVHGVTVFRGIAGFGKKGEIHSEELLRLVANLPVIIEFFDEPAVIEEALEALHDLVPPGHLVSWRSTCPIEYTLPPKPTEKIR
jgi:PII-like signaling protein